VKFSQNVSGEFAPYMGSPFLFRRASLG